MSKSICILTTAYPKWPLQEGEFPNGKYIHDMSVAFVEKGYRLYIVTHNHDNSKDYEEVDGIKIFRFNYFIKRWQFLTDGTAGIPYNIQFLKAKLLVPFYLISMIFKTIVIIKKYEIDFINAHWAVPTGFIAVIVKILTRKKLITTIYGAELFPVINGKMKFLIPFIKIALHRADVVVGISKATVNAANAISDRSDIKFIPDGIDINKYKPGTRDYKLLQKYNIHENEKAIFFTGNMIERKGHRILLEAFKNVLIDIPELRLILGGKGPLFNKLTELRRQLDLENQVIMPGFIPDSEVIPLLQSCDVYVLPSCIDSNGDTEGSATAALEAMACGTIAIISEVGGNIDTINDGEGAYYFRNSDPKDLAKVLKQIFEDTFVTDKSNSVSRNFIFDNYRWENIINRYIATFKEYGFS